MYPRVIFLTLLTASLSAGAYAQDSEYAKAIDDDLQAASVINVSETGDIILFGGTVVVPFVRPSVDKCGVHMSKTATERSASVRQARRDADATAKSQRYSPRDAAKYVRGATAPLKQCERRFEERCAEVRSSVPLETRTEAIDIAKKSVTRLAKGPEEKRDILTWLDNVLAACPLQK